MSCRDEILRCIHDIVAVRPERDFRLFEVVERMRDSGSTCTRKTIELHVASLMCSDSPQRRTTIDCVLTRIGRGQYRLNLPPRHPHEDPVRGPDVPSGS